MIDLSTAKKLAEDHWSYIEGILIAHDQDMPILKICHYHYVTAFVHGYKHAIEDMIDAGRPEKEKDCARNEAD